jgi:glycosyltransferase involved in cell wall biosynthesis
VSSNFPPDVGGPAVSANYLAQELIKKGIHTRVLTNGINKRVKDPDYVTRTKYVKQKKNSLIGAFLRIFYLFKALLKIGKEYDYIISQDVNISGLPVYLASFFNKKPYIVKFSGDLAVEYLQEKQKIKDIQADKSLSARILHYIQRVICNSSKYSIATSKYVKKCMIWIGVKKQVIKLLPNGVVKQRIDSKIVNKFKKKYGNNSICTASRLVKWKNIDFLIKAMKELPEYKLVIYGKGPEKKRLQKIIKDLKVNNVFMHGAVPYTRIQSYIKACDYFALASSYEPFGIAVLDALIVKVPVIVSSVGGMPELVDKNGLVFKENNIKDFKKKLKKLKNIKVSSIQKYEWKNLIKDYMRLLK